VLVGVVGVEEGDDSGVLLGFEELVHALFELKAVVETGQTLEAHRFAD